MDIKRILLGPSPKPECPIVEDDKQWIETNLLWLIQELGKQKLTEAPTILLNKQFFPDQYEETPESVETMFNTVCRLMRIERDSVELMFYSDYVDPSGYGIPLHGQTHEGPAGLYLSKNDTYIVAIEAASFSNPITLIATMAHELAHVHLLGHKMIDAGRVDHEPLSDLFVIFSGMGIFTANSAFQFRQWDKNMQQGWSARRLGYLPEPMIGYALACYAWLRNEHNPRWSKQVAYNVRVFMKRTTKYFELTGDTRLKRE